MASEGEAGGSLQTAEPVPLEAQSVVLRGHLHPAVLVLRLLDGLSRAFVPFLLGLVAREPVLLIVAGALFLLQLGHALVRYLTFHYTLTDAELITREGILHRQERRIPIDRVQDLGFESTLLRRFLGLAVVRVETASGQGVEAVLDSLAKHEAERLREVLLALRASRSAARPVEGAPGSPTANVRPAEPEWRVFAADAGQLLLRGLTDLRLSAVFVAVFGAYQLADELGVLTRIQGVSASFWQWVLGFPRTIVVLLLGGLAAGALALLAATAAIGNWMVFHGFVLTLRGDALGCRHGLLTTRQKTLPRARIQRVRVEQTWLRRLLGVAVVRADSAGSGHDEGQEVAGGLDVVVPLAARERIDALLPAVLPGLAASPGSLRRASPLLVVRVFVRGVLQVFALCGAAFAPLGVHALYILALTPIAWLTGRLWWHNLAFGLAEHHLYLRTGLIGCYQVFVPTAKVQAVAIRSGPVQRWLGLSELLVYVAGGPPTRIPDLPIDEARALALALAERGARADGTLRRRTRAGFTREPA